MEEFKFKPPPSPRNWTEDFEHENGCYENQCIKCDQFFFGYKRRVVCKECSNKVCPLCASGNIHKEDGTWNCNNCTYEWGGK